MRSLLRGILLAGLCGQITSAMALMVADIDVASRLNETLDARISLEAAQPAELESLSIRVRETDGHSPTLPRGLKFEVMGEQNGHYIHVTSAEPVREPALVFSLEISWSGGRLVREYSILLDPKN